jgi:hypothetical protein
MLRCLSNPGTSAASGMATERLWQPDTGGSIASGQPSRPGGGLTWSAPANDGRRIETEAFLGVRQWPQWPGVVVR